MNQGVVYLQGELGAGKTTLVRGYLRNLGYEGLVKSPTYTLVEPYDVGELTVAHLDLYRVNDPTELEFMGLEDVLRAANITFVEWPDRGRGYLPAADRVIQLAIIDPGRIATLG